MSLFHEEKDIFPICKYRIAITGKGGVGKTIIAALMGRCLRETKQRVLLVDADPAMGLAYLLGADVTKTIGRYSEHLNKNPKAKREIESASIKDVLIRESLLQLDEATGMLIMGKDEGSGCFCGINELLKYGIGAIARDYDFMIIDCEAGLEQVRRRVLNSVNTLFVISDMSARGIKTAHQIGELIARGDVDMIAPDNIGLLINRYKENEEFLKQAKEETGMELLGSLPEDEDISKLDREGGTIEKLSAESPSLIRLYTILKSLKYL